jgi:excisionase family DNA binding protein
LIDVGHRLLSVSEVAERLGVSRRTVERKIATGEIPALQLGGKHSPIRVDAAELRDHRSGQGSVDLRRVHADALVIQTSRGRPQSRRNALRAVHKAGDKAGLNGGGRQPVGLQDLRHSFVALALASNASLAEAAALARHANAKVTATVYAGLTDGGREVAAAKLVEAGFGR